jgi:hypothetical protein
VRARSTADGPGIQQWSVAAIESRAGTFGFLHTS